MLPGGDSLKRLMPLVRNYAGDELTWDVHLILTSERGAARCRSGARPLGWTTWLGPRRSERNAADLLLDPNCQCR